MSRSRRKGSVAPPTKSRPSWLARVSLAPPSGRRRVRVSKCFATREAAEAWVAQAHDGRWDPDMGATLQLVARGRVGASIPIVAPYKRMRYVYVIATASNPDAVVYVGQTHSPAERASSHYCKDSPIGRWVRQAEASGDHATMTIVASCGTIQEANRMEAQLHRYYGGDDGRLLNYRHHMPYNRWKAA